MCPACSRLINGKTGDWTTRGFIVCHCLLIETPETLILVDTGLGQQDILATQQRLGSLYPKLFHPKLDLDETALAQVKALGYMPEDVQHIILTHVDLDHAGGLADFPHAQVHVLEPELEQLYHPSWRDKQRFKWQQFNHQPNWKTHGLQEETWFGFERIQVIANISADIALIPLIGHTRGHTGVAIKQQDQWLLHCGDAYYHHSQLTDIPQTPVGLACLEAMVQSSRQKRLWNQHRLRQLAQTHANEVALFCSHDPVEFERYLKY